MIRLIVINKHFVMGLKTLTHDQSFIRQHRRNINTIIHNRACGVRRNNITFGFTFQGYLVSMFQLSFLRGKGP